MGKVLVTVDELSSTPMEVTAGDRKETLQPTQSRHFEGTSITIAEASTEENPAPTSGEPRDVFDHNNPNGITRAEIAPKLPKAAGELVQRPADDGSGRILEESLPDPTGLATAGGGPEGAEEGKTPGPQPDGRGVVSGQAPQKTGVDAATTRQAVDEQKSAGSQVRSERQPQTQTRGRTAAKKGR